MSKMVLGFWKSVEKIVRHNYNVVYERKKQEVREKKLDQFVSKHLRLSSRVARSLKDKTETAMR